MSAVSELKVIISFKENITVGIDGFIKAENQLKKNTLDVGNVIKKVFGKKHSLTLDTKVKNAEVMKTRKELEASFHKIKANISSSTLGKSISSLKKLAKEKVINAKIAVAVSKESFDIGVQDFRRKALLKVEKPIDSIKQKLQPLKKMSYLAIALKDMTGDRLKILTRKPRKMLITMGAKTLSSYNNAVGFINRFKKPTRSDIEINHKSITKLKSFSNRLNVIGRMRISPSVSIKDNISSKLKNLGSSVISFAKNGLLGIANLASKGIIEAVKSGAILEKQDLYMDQAITKSNPQLGSEEVKTQRNSYMKQLRDSAAGTGMDSGDIIKAGTQAVSIAGGDIKEAMELVKVAQDMAALNPGKTVAEAMDALSAAKGGDISSLEAFGAKATADDINKLGLQGVVQQKLKPQFAGGAEKFSDTGGGLVSVIKGKLNNKMQDMGLGIIEKLKPALKSVVMLIDRYSPALDAFGEGIASGIGIAMIWVKNIAGLIGEKFSWIGEKTGFLKEVFQVSWAGIQDRMATAWEVIQPVMDLIANGAMLLFNIFQWAFPGIQAVIENVWAFVQPLLEGLGSAIGWVADKVGMMAEWFDKEPGGKSGGGGGGVGAFGGKTEETLALSRVPISAGMEDALKMPAVPGTSQKSENSIINNKLNAYMATKANLPNNGTNVQNQAININISGVNKSTNEIMSEMMPKLRLALQNISPGPSGHARVGGALA